MRFIPKPDETVISTIDLMGPIDYLKLKERIEARGPLCVTYTEYSVSVMINITPCQVEHCECGEDVIAVVLTSGFTSLSTIVSRSSLEEYSSINDFAHHYLHHPHLIFRPSGECQYIEGQIREHLGMEPMEIYKYGTPEGGVRESLSEECQSDFWKANNLSAIFQSLVIHQQMRDGVDQINPDQTIRDAFPKPSDLTALMDEHYSLGFLTARLISEHFVRYEIEPLAAKGLAQVEAQQRRNKASGQKSAQKRHQRIEATLAAMERLCDENPAIGRIGIKALADLAMQDAAKLDRNLWKQGSGQRDEYLEEMRADLRYQKRFRRLSQKTA